MSASMERMALDAVGASAEGNQAESPAGAQQTEPTDVMIGEDVAALAPIVMGPAYQILPLAICS